MLGLGAPELLIVLVVMLLLFGGAKVPQLARSLGQAKKEFESATDQPAPSVEPAAKVVTVARTAPVARPTVQPKA